MCGETFCYTVGADAEQTVSGPWIGASQYRKLKTEHDCRITAASKEEL